jgi:LysR family transcriptional regulator, transcription activator of glutamate synthase operon
MDDISAQDITFADLEMLVAFARTEHFGNTAAELGVSVATVQRTIRSLERKLGVPLIEQAGRRVRMLRAGNVLVREANAVLRARQDAVDNTLTDAGHPQRLLRIAHTFSLGLGFVPRVLAELLTKHPGLRFRCWQGSANDVVAALLRGEADVAFTSVAPSEQDFVVEPLFIESLLLAVPADDPLAQETSVPLRAVRDRSFVSMELGSSSRAHMVNACARAGFVPRITIEGNDLFVVESMVGAGIGVSIVPEGMTDHQHPSVVRIPIVDPTPAGRTVFLAYPRAGAQYKSVHDLARIARDHGRRPQESLHELQ